MKAVAPMIDEVRQVLCLHQCSSMRRDGRCSTEDGMCLLAASMNEITREIINRFLTITHKMSEAGIDALAAGDDRFEDSAAIVARIWTAMLAAWETQDKDVGKP